MKETGKFAFNRAEKQKESNNFTSIKNQL